jgi:predicted nucleotide-binding protein
MYTLLVTGAASDRDSGTFQMEAGRFLEWTDDALAAQLKPFSVEAAACLESWPCILIDEGRADQVVRIGRVTRAFMARREVKLTFEPLALPVSLTNGDLLKLSGELDIGDFEFSRNHISVKDRDLFRVLSRGGFDVGEAVTTRFAELPLPAPPRAELLSARDVIAVWGHTEIDDLLLDIGSPELGTSRGTGSRRDRANAIVRFALEHPEAKTAENSLLSAYLVRRTQDSSSQSASETPARFAASLPSTHAPTPTEPAQSSSGAPNRVFVVHGQSDDARTAVVQHLRAVGLAPIVLHEQPSMGQHLLTKFVREAELVTFAVVLMTDDDVGGRSAGELRPRARQNVILELGYFLAHLRQHRVCALITPGLETPSDFDGIVYIRMDAEGLWREELTRELRAADMPLAGIEEETT